MKKLYLFVFTALFLINTNTFSQEETVVEKTDEVLDAEIDETASDTEISLTEVPSFDNADVQAYVDSYQSYIIEYAKVVKSKDMAKMADLGEKAIELRTMAQKAMKNLSGNDVKRLTEYMTEKSKEIQTITEKLMAY